MKNSKDNFIHVGDKYCFQIDAQCLTLYKSRINKKGAMQYDVVGYYTSLEAMYQRLVEIGLEDCRNLQDIADRQTQLKKDIMESMKNTLVAISNSAVTVKKPSGIPV